MESYKGDNTTQWVSLIVPDEPYSITAEAVPDSLPADGVSTALIAATVQDQYDNPVADGTSVAFTTTLGVITPTLTAMSQGVVTATFTAGTVVGTALITATADSRVGSAQVALLPGPPSALALTAYPTSLLADGVSTAVITATVQDQHDNFVADGTSVAFTTTLGVITPTLSATSQGVVTATLTSETRVGRAIVTARVDSLAETTAVDVLAGPPFTLTVGAHPTSLLADGDSTAAITVTVRDEWDNLVADGTSVAFTTTLGTITPTLSTTSQGVATATLTAGAEVGPAEVTAAVDGRTASTTVDLIPGPPFALTVEADPLSIPADGVSTSTITVTVQDQWDHPVADDTAVTFTTSRGTFPTGRVYIAATTGGVAAALLTSGTEEGTAIVSVVVEPIPTPRTVEIAFVYHRIYLPLIWRAGQGAFAAVGSTQWRFF